MNNVEKAAHLIAPVLTEYAGEDDLDAAIAVCEALDTANMLCEPIEKQHAHEHSWCGYTGK